MKGKNQPTHSVGLNIFCWQRTLPNIDAKGFIIATKAVKDKLLKPYKSAPNPVLNNIKNT